MARQDQLGVYQLAVQQGAFAAVAGPDARPAGAELVYLRLADGPGTLPRVFQQASLDDVPFPAGSSEAAGTAGPPTWVHGRLAEAARIIREERFEARPSGRLSLLPVPDQLSGPERWPAGGDVSLHVLRPPAPTARLQSTDDLVEALGIEFSDQQLAAITAPLEPASSSPAPVRARPR